MSDDGREPIDPDFADLFRDEPPAPVSPAEPPLGAEPARVQEPSTPAAETGRLFRSQGADAGSVAVLAVPAERAGRLRTLTREEPRPASEAPAPPVPATAGPADEPWPAPVTPDERPADAAEAAFPVTSLDLAPASADEAPAWPPAQQVVPAAGDAAVFAAATTDSPPGERHEEVPTAARRSRRGGEHRARSISAGAAYVIVIGVTLVVGVVNALLADGDIGWPTGLALLVSSAYVALTIRPDDAAVAVIVPPIAFALTAATAGQAFLGSSASSLLNRGVVWFFDLADSWPWIIGSTALALAIVLVRRFRH